MIPMASQILTLWGVIMVTPRSVRLWSLFGSLFPDWDSPHGKLPNLDPGTLCSACQRPFHFLLLVHLLVSEQSVDVFRPHPTDHLGFCHLC